MAFLSNSLHPLLLGAALLGAGVLAPAHQARAAWPQGIANAEVVRTLTASNGNVFIAGNFSGEAQLGAYTLNAVGLQDVFVARLDAGGRVLWATSGGGNLTDAVSGMTLDASNNVYIAGTTYGTAQFGGVTMSDVGGRQDGFVARLSAAGQWMWANRIASAGTDTANDLVVLPGDNTQVPPVPDVLFVTGSYTGTVRFHTANGSGTRDLTTNVGQIQDDFLARLRTDGSEWIWAGNRPGAGMYEVGTRLLLDSQSRLHMLGIEATGTSRVLDQAFLPTTDALGSQNSRWAVESGGGRAHIVSSQHFGILRQPGALGSGASPGLALNRGPVSVVLRDPIDASRSGKVTISMKAWRGPTVGVPAGGLVSGGYTYQQYASEHPDLGAQEGLLLEYLDSYGHWRVVGEFHGGGPAGEVGVQRTFSYDPSVSHPNLKVRIRQVGGSGGEFDWWFVENVAVEISANEGYLHSISNLRAADPSWGSVVRFPGSFSIEDAATWSVGGNPRVAVVGEFHGNVRVPGTACGGNVTHPSGGGGFVSVFTPSGSGYVCNTLQATGGARARAVVGEGAHIFVAGSFTTALDLGAPQTLTAHSDDDITQPARSDVFIAALDTSSDEWGWLTGGATLAGNPAAPAGGLGEDTARSIAVAVGGQLYVGGSFQVIAQFGPVDTLAAQGATDGFLVKLGTDGRFFQPETWPVGVPVTPPPSAATADVTSQPEFFLDGQQIQAIGLDYRWFAWARKAGGGFNLIPLQPTPQVEVRWRVQGAPLESSQRIVTQGAGAWPTSPCGDNDIPGANRPDGCFQNHVVGAPVEAKPSEYQIVGDIIAPSNSYSGATLDAGVFNAPRSGFAVIQYVHGPTMDQSVYPTYVEVVRSLPYQLTPGFQDGVSVEIGKKIVSTAHNEPNRTGWVVNELAYYDGHGVNAAYNRAVRLGSIIPVNRYTSSGQQDLAVAWYRRNGKGVYWASRAVRYQPRWPYDPDRIVIASEQGSEVFGQQVLTAAAFPQAHIYVQNDVGLPGFNPNDEHALMAPSATGTGVDAVFALRSDFGSAVNDTAAASDPYVLLKYYNTGLNEWNFKLYRVQATGAGYSRFRYSGTAGTTVSPPYPVRLLPGCAESRAGGQAQGEPPPPPFFQDHKNQMWAKSAGTGTVHYFYPMQPGFYQDNNHDNANDYAVGQCTPWLARLPESDGGAASDRDPIPVEYVITWPETPPLLIAGETLLTPKRGLPDIYNQAAVEIVYDDNRDTQANAGPADTLAQLIDPLSSRWVRLPQLPASIASEQRTDGFRDIVGSSDGVLKMPASLGERMYYDAMNRRLVLQGVFDETGAGEPKLLLNVLSNRERKLLKRLDGGDGTEESNFDGDCLASGGCTWDQAVEALYRLSRNPSGIDRICREATLGEDNERICNDLDTDLSPDELLIAYEDPAGNGMLQPLSVLGGAALTAGAATGSGYMTIAFNNDPSLGALPVSLEVIRVGCLESTNPPIHAPYQGQINVISPGNIFDEQLVLRHGGDFGGNPDALQFEWYFHPDANGTPPMPLPSPETGQMHGWIQFPVADSNGAVEISIEGANIQTLSDNWYLARYRGLSACNNESTWSLWAGQPGSTPIAPRAQLAEGWVKRVLGRLNPFEARVQNFGESATNNYASMLIQLGERYSGPVALNNDPDNLNSMGLIEAYTTVMRRAMQLSADSTPPIDYGPANAAILLVASRLVDFYTLLGNEAYADAQDPTIAIDSDGGTYSLSPTIFNFQNQLESLLDEELVLLRGRDDAHGPVAASPVYNRLFWNFTTGDGEVAYALSYNVSDQDVNGVINEYDARILFPQGHGDAWGHYLTAMKTYYGLLRHPFFSWNPQSEAVLVAGVPINVDFLDERQFAQTAMYKARAGAEIVDLTYRKAYTEDPAGQYQGYDDTNAQRAWGLSEWGRRAGMGAYFDWVTANAILPEEDPNPAHVGIQRIERGNISELSEIAGHYTAIQSQVDKADRGLNPLGLAKNVVSFDIDPAQLICTGSPCNTKTQFEQVWDRAMGALTNALKVWDYANQLSNQLRRTQESADDLWDNSIAQETDFTNQLIEIFGYPYADDIGGGGTYPDGYNGPDLYHYMYIDAPALAGTQFDFDTPIENLGVNRVKRWKGYYSPMGNGLGFFNTTVSPILGGDAPDGVDCTLFPMGAGCPLGNKPYGEVLEVEYTLLQSPAIGTFFTKPQEWTGQRRAPGRIQQALQELLMAQVSLKQGILEYDKMRLDMEATIATLRATFDTQEENINVAHEQRQTLGGLTAGVQLAQTAATIAHRVASYIDATFEDTAHCIPDSMIVGLAGGGDIFSAAACSVDIAGSTTAFAIDTVGDGLEIAGNIIEASKEDVSEMNAIRTMINDANLDLYNIVGDVDALMREEPMLRSEIYARAQAVQQLVGEYHAALAEGQRTLEQLQVFRRSGAAATQQNRYKDMAFRIFRNDALQKYRAAFDLAARYVYLAASAYDYETNLLGSNGKAGQRFLTSVVKERSIGQILGGTPMPGTPGLADTMAQLKLNFDVLKGQMGFNSPQVETQRFSLRRELFRIEDGEAGDGDWRRILEAARVPDLRQLPEYRRYARPFAPESAGPQPGLVFEFSTNVTWGMNFFGWDLGPYDSSYNSSRFATRIRSVGAWFGNYVNLPLADDPNVYLFPVGADVLRSPDPLDFTVREWQVVDQAIPVPFPVGAADLNRYDWLPTHNLDGAQTDVRRYPMMRAYHFSEPFDDSQITNDSRLVGRSVWNRKWLLIIPGGTFLNDPNDGLDTFIHGARVPGGGGVRDGNGVDDIRIFFKTYSYSGN